jgi:hypothetical protein
MIRMDPRAALLLLLILFIAIGLLASVSFTGLPLLWSESHPHTSLPS